ncbi:Phosphatidylethanolamine-binding protein 1 [Linderina macrospora]|uniref:Phosphatidylethanolamine-binding protein 1 n=1 Tax=Linderina macrospora TaxID=4868 RepID=A0ACC1JBN0_9FUNG|nr:Phosphatidylethanolamine-binding protein 1 [Linderina macrospora]
MRAFTVLTALSCALGVYADGGVNFDFASPLIGNLESNEIIPDVFPTTFEPKIFLNVTYSHMVNSGNILKATESAEEPIVEYTADGSKFYTLAFVEAGDPTLPNRTNDLTRDWLVVNIPGSDVAKGDSTGTPYKGSKDPECGMTRYVYALAEQPSKISDLTVPESREKFDLMGYLNDNKMKLVGANYFIAVGKSGDFCPGASLASDDEDSQDESEEKLSRESLKEHSKEHSKESSKVHSAELHSLDSEQSSSHSHSAVKTASGSQTSQPNGASGNSSAGFVLPMAVVFAMAAASASGFF